MQNKYLMIAAAVSALVMAAPAQAQTSKTPTYRDGSLSPLSGIYAGGYGGYSWNDADINGGPDLNVDGGDYGLFIGYQMDTLLDRTIGMGINGALEFHYGWSDADDHSTIAGVPFKTEKNHEWGINFRPGFSFVDEYAFGLKPYGIIGYRNAQFETSGGGVSGKENFDGFELGLGTELIAFQNFGVRADYTHVWYEDKGGIDPSGDELRLGVAYHF